MSEPPAIADVVVLGGGVSGASIAYHLAHKGAGRIVLLERRSVASGPTGRSTAMVRRFYSMDFFSHVANAAADVFQHWAERIGGGDPGFRQVGYFVLATADKADILRQNVLRAQDVGSRVEIITADDLRRLIPEMSLDLVALASYEAESGFADPVATTRAFADRAADLGALVLEHTPVDAILADSGRIRGVRTAVGQTISCPKVVVCAGPWAPALLEPLGVRVDIRPTRHQMAMFRRPAGFAGHPAIADTTLGTYMRPGFGDMSVFGVGAYQEVVDADDFNQSLDGSEVGRNLDLFARRFPPMRDALFAGGYAAVYDVTPDMHPVLGPIPQVDGLYACFGWSGHGFKHSPVMGEIIADVVLHGRSPEYDLTPFRLARFEEGDLLPPGSPIAASPI